MRSKKVIKIQREGNKTYLVWLLWEMRTKLESDSDGWWLTNFLNDSPLSSLLFFYFFSLVYVLVPLSLYVFVSLLFCFSFLCLVDPSDLLFRGQPRWQWNIREGLCGWRGLCLEVIPWLLLLKFWRKFYSLSPLSLFIFVLFFFLVVFCLAFIASNPWLFLNKHLFSPKRRISVAREVLVFCWD